MGNPSLQPQFDQSTTVTGNQYQSSSTSITHFSHPHPLHLTILGSQQQGINFNTYNNLCSGCKHEASGTIYTCTVCNYSLHHKCSQMPQQITHPFDANNHVLSLLSKPAYAEGIFSCDACGEKGNGFSYHCQTCGIDLHILCASLPLTITHQSHHHQLSLTFSPPYSAGTFLCDLCRGGGSKNWLYRCHACEFDVHPSCVNMLPSNHRPRPQQAANVATHFAGHGGNHFVGHNSFAPAAAAGGFSPFLQPAHLQPVSRISVGATPYAAAPVPLGMSQNNFVRPRPPGSFGAPVMNPAYAQQNTMANQMAVGVGNGIASGVSQAATQAMIQGIFGGGDNGGGVNPNDAGGFGTGADVGAADTGSYFVSDGDYSTQMDGGGDFNTTTY